VYTPPDIFAFHDEGDQGPSATSPRAGLRLPSKEQLTYAKELMTVVLLALAFPWLIVQLLTRPSTVLAAAGRKHVGKPD
jgi:hypothetical protein